MLRHPEYAEVNEFVRPPEGYQRDLNVLEHAIIDSATYLHLETGKDFDTCVSFVRKEISAEGTFPLKPKEMKITFRQPNGDRIGSKMDFDRFLKGVISANHILTPNMVVYTNPRINKSFIAEFIDNKMAERSVVKKRQHKAKQEGNTNLFTFCINRQNTIKLLLNSTSGAHASPHNPLYNKTAHSSLTSTCRIATSYSNANTERLLSGNRHYWNANVALANIISVTRHSDYDKIQAVVNKYNLVIPTPEQTAEVVFRSTKYYWQDEHAKQRIISLITKLNDLQRAAFVYSGDLHHVAKYNENFVRGFIGRLITRPSEKVDDPGSVVSRAGDDVIALCGILCADILAGTTPRDLADKNPEGYQIYAATINHVETIFAEYQDFIEAFLATDNLPPSIYAFPSSIRHCVVGSDTDSTMFTTQDWVEWYFGKLCFGPEADALSNALIFINSQMVAHCLAQASRQMGIVDENLYRLKMKNEFAFPIYMRANRAKHYATIISACEGNVYAEPEIEIKGVALKDSKNPPKLMKALEDDLHNVMLDIMAGKGVSSMELKQRMANREHEVFQSFYSGSIEYLSKVFIKERDAYKKPESSNYLHYMLWQEVFAPKYGEVAEPPYVAVKVGISLPNNTAMDAWLSKIDVTVAERLRAFMEKTGRKSFTQFLLPLELVEKGIPAELAQIVDARRLVSEMFLGNYILLEMLGFYYRNKHNTRLLSDEVPYYTDIKKE